MLFIVSVEFLKKLGLWDMYVQETGCAEYLHDASVVKVSEEICGKEVTAKVDANLPAFVKIKG